MTERATDQPVSVAAGRVLGSRDATPLKFWVAVEPGSTIQLDDTIAVTRPLPEGDINIYGVVTEVSARYEGGHFDSDVFLIADGALPANISEVACVQVSRVEPETLIPPHPGAQARLAAGAERDEGLRFSDMDHRLPAGLSRNGEPVYLDFDFVDGTKGAHINISGISGVATKTSYATFLLYTMLHTRGLLGAHAANTKGLVFNVKGEDLMFLDHPNRRLAETQRVRYAPLGVPAGPFQSVQVLAPPRPGGGLVPDTGARRTGVGCLYWSVAEFCAQRLLPFLFADGSDENQQYTIVLGNVTEQLARVAESSPPGGAVAIDGQMIRTFSGLVDAIAGKLTGGDDAETDPDTAWTGRAVTSGSVNAFVRRLGASVRHIEPLVRGDGPGGGADLDPAQITVVDLHRLHDRAKRFVVGVVLRQAFDTKERAASRLPQLFVVLDELNKYAPRDGSSPIKELLLDVAERGRSLGIILIGAQQTASEVERRVVANCAVRVIGRLDAAEAMRDTYGFLPAAQRQRATILKPGSLYVSQPPLPIPLLVEFPFPAWATTPAEAGRRDDDADAAPADPFEGL